jgi:hypothetical protein
MSKRSDRLKALDGNAFGLSSYTSSQVSGAQQYCAYLVFLSTHTFTIATTVMATAVSLDRSIALSVSADHLVGRYDLKVCARLTRYLNCE